MGTFLGLAGVWLVIIFGLSLLAGSVTTYTVVNIGNGTGPTIVRDSTEYTSPLAGIASVLSGLVNFVFSCATFRAAYVALGDGKVSFAQAFQGIGWVPAFVVALCTTFIIAFSSAITCGIALFAPRDAPPRSRSRRYPAPWTGQRLDNAPRRHLC